MAASESKTTYGDKPWLQHYPASVPHQVNPDEYDNLLEFLKYGFQKYKTQTAFENMGKGMTYQEVDHLSRDFAAWLQFKGFKKGDRIAVQMPNLLQFPVVVFGALRAGMTVVNTNPLYTPKEMRHQFKDSGAKAIVILSNFASQLDEIIADTQIETVIVTDIGDLVVKRIKKMVPKYSLPGHLRLKNVLREGRSKVYEKPVVKNTDVAFLQYTGGTTGVSKGASLSHRNILSNMMQIFAWIKPRMSSDGTEVIITALPMYHIFALTVNCMAFFGQGGKNILITNPRDIPGFIKELKKHKFTVITGVNTLFNALLNNTEFKGVDFSNLKLSLGGGMAVQDVVARKWEEVTDCYLAEAYGLSEASPGLTANPLDGTHRIGYIGVPLPSTEITLADDDGNPVPVGSPGELFAKGPQVMSGYWEKKEENDKVFHDGWLKTGDIAIMTEDGFFKIVDRKKEMILVSGFNVFPNEVEGAIAEHAKVLEVGVIGVPHPKSGEAVKACVVKKDDSLTKEEVIAWCKERLTGYKVPKEVEFWDELPKSNVGKILRRKLKKD
ncbi:UNVERIFIED_CONTAM: hypothetical protein GTU68_029098 [Idotea baltica]|nr:hypothetical protein [Idotea baltica]